MANKGVKFKDASGNAVYPCPYYPVGSIYMSVNNIDPSNFFGGTWEQIKDRFLLSAGNTYTAGNTGGSEKHKHLLPFGISNNIGNWEQMHWNKNFDYGYQSFTSPNYNNINNTPIGSSKTMYQPYTQNVSNMPPYLVVYVWKRTA